MATIKSFEDFEIWKKAQQLAADIYLFTEQHPKISKDFSFKDQIKRAVLSISNNIAEGFEYNNNNDFIKYLRFAKGSTGEVRNCLYFTLRVGFAKQQDIQHMINFTIHLGNQIGNLIKYLKEKRTTTRNSRPATRNKNV